MARLRRADCSGPGIHRVKRGRGFSYVDNEGRKVAEPEVLGRIGELVIPPAWKDVWICPYPMGHIQATGVDAAGRKQYLYHPKWREQRDRAKFDDMVAFARDLPKLRRSPPRSSRPTDSMSRERVLACALRLLDHGFFRIGSEDYAVTNETYGLATMRKEHVDAGGRGHDGLRLHRQVRQAPGAGRRRPAELRGRLHPQAPPLRRRRAARLQGRPRAGATSSRPTSTPS